MGYSAGFGSALWAIGQDLDLLSVIGAGFGSALGAIAQDLDPRYWQQCRIWICAMGHSAEFGSALQAIVQDLHYGQQCRYIDQSTEQPEIYRKLVATVNSLSTDDFFCLFLCKIKYFTHINIQRRLFFYVLDH